MNPFQSHLTPHGFMVKMLAAIGQKAFPLPDDLEKAAIAFLQRLTVLGYAKFELDDGEFLRSTDMKQVQSMMGNICKINLDNKSLACWISLHSSGIVCVVKGEVRSLAERRN